MTVSRPNRHGRTAHPALIGLIVGLFIWLILAVAGQDLVTDYRQVSARTSVAFLAVLKEMQVWVALGIGGLTALWASQVRRRESPEVGSFIEWSASLPQWKPELASSETAAFVVPVERVDAGHFERRPQLALAAPSGAPAAHAVSENPEPAPPVPTRSLPGIRLAPLQQMADKFSARNSHALQRMPAPELALAAPVRHGLVSARRVAIPPALPLERLHGMAHAEIEALAGEFYRRQGYDVAALGHGRYDAGVDLLCQRPGEVVVVKCAASEEDVTMEPVRELLSMVMGEGATRGVFLTTGKFSRKALKFAHRKGRGRLELVDGRKFAALLRACAAGAGSSPACPCCGGPMSMEEERRFLRAPVLAWVCNAEACVGVIRQGDPPPQRRLVVA